MRDEVVAQHGRDRDLALALLRLGLDKALDRVPAPLDSDDARREVHIAPAKRLQLTAPQPRVHRGSPQRPVLVRQHAQQLGGLLRRGDPVSLAAGRWQPEAGARVDRDLSAVERPPVDGAERQKRALDGGRAQTPSLETLDVVL